MSESAGKALDILFYLANVGEGVSLARLSKETGMNKATALRYLNGARNEGGGGALSCRDGRWVFHSSNWAARCPYASLLRKSSVRLSRGSPASPANLSILPTLQAIPRFTSIAQRPTAACACVPCPGTGCPSIAPGWARPFSPSSAKREFVPFWGQDHYQRSPSLPILIPRTSSPRQIEPAN